MQRFALTLVLLMLTGAAFAESEVWVSARTDGKAGTGTAADPFDGSTQAKFDAVFAALKPATCVHLGAGTFHTKGAISFTLKPETKVRGAGMEVTRIIQDCSGKAHAVVFVGAEGIEIQDMSIDCGYENQRKVNGVVKCNAAAIHLSGSNLAVRRVRVCNYGSPYDNECGENFAVAIFQPPQPDGKNLLIEDCVFTGMSVASPTGCSVLTISGGPLSSKVNVPSWARGAVARRNTFTGYHPGCHGITMSGCQGAVVEGNHFEHFMGCAIYTDTWPLRDHVYQNNLMVDVNQGIFLAADTWDLVNFQIRGNVLLLHNGFDVVKIDKGVVTTDIPNSLMVGNELGFRELKIAGGSVKNDQGVFVTAVLSPTTFTYSAAKGGKSDPADAATGGFIYALRYGYTTPTPEGMNLFSGNGKDPHALKNFVISGNTVRPYSSDGSSRIPSTGIRICGADNSRIFDNTVFDAGNHGGLIVGKGKHAANTVICRDNYNIDNTRALPRDDRGNLYPDNLLGPPAPEKNAPPASQPDKDR
jgi:hypothetical protein